MAATIQELKEMIVNLRIENIKCKIPSGHCPYVYYNMDNPIDNCNEMSCDKCSEIFLDNMRKQIEKEVASL